MGACKNSLYKQSFPMAVFGAAVISSLFTGSALAQDFKRADGSVPLPMDWSDQHLIYTVGSTPEQMERMQGDPRFFVAMRLHGKALADESEANGYPTLSRTPRWEPSADPIREYSGDPAWRSRPEPPWPEPPWPPRRGPGRRASFLQRELKEDWSVSLGAGGVAAGQSPAKFSFDVNAAPSCTNDYVAFPINAPTGATRASVTGIFTGRASPTYLISFTVTPSVGTAVTTEVYSSLTSNSGIFFEVNADTTIQASNFAAAINRNLSGTAVGQVVAVSSSSTVTVYSLTPGNRVSLTEFTNLPQLSFGAVTAGTNGTQANIVGFNNLYSGTTPTPFCAGKTFPTFIFSYESGVGPVITSPTISLDGTKIAYIENDSNIGAILHVLTFGSGATEYGTCSNSGTALPTCTTGTGPVVPGGTAGSTATDFMIPLLAAFATATSPTATAIPDARSAPFVNYATDTLFVGDNTGNLYSVTPVFLGTPTLAGGNFPVTVSSGNFLNSPVVDVSRTGNIFVGDSLSNVYEYSSTGVLKGASVTIGNGTNGGIWDGAVVDSTNSKVYYTTNCNPGLGTSALAQIPFTFSGFGTVISVIDTNGEGCSGSDSPQYAATPDNLYYTAGITSGSIGSNGHILVSYQGTGSIRLAEWGFVSGALQTTTIFNTNSIYTAASVGSSPSTEFEGKDVIYTPTALTQSGTTVTVTTATNLFFTGDVVTIAGVAAGSGGCTSAAVAAINGEQTVTVLSAMQFTFTSAVSTAITSGSCHLTGSSATGPTQDYLFFGSGQPAVYTFTLPMTSNSQTPSVTNTTSVTSVTGNASATSGIIVDNDSNNGQASSIYYGTQATSTTQCGTTAAYCAVKLTQSGLQ
jgi:hypothetical protein